MTNHEITINRRFLVFISVTERKSLQAAAIAQEMTGAPVSMHPAAHHNSPFDLMRIFLEAGGKKERTVICHMECTLVNRDEIQRK